MKNTLIRFATISAMSLTIFACASPSSNDTNEMTSTTELPASITVKGIALNPEGIEYNKKDGTFLLSSLNAAPITKVQLDGTYTPFTSGEQFPLSTAGLQIDYKRNRLLAAGFNGTELYDNDPATKGISHLRIYSLETGVLEKDINLSSLMPDANMYFANDVAIDNDGNAYVSDWFAGVIYKVDVDGVASVFWTNNTGIPGGPNGLDFHPDGYLLVSVINDGSYTKHALVKIPINQPDSATTVQMSNAGFAGFDGMVITNNGTVIGVTNDGKTPGGNVLVELSGEQAWKTATVDNSIAITTSTTVAVTQGNDYFVINQDFSDGASTTWTIEQIKFK